MGFGASQTSFTQIIGNRQIETSNPSEIIVLILHDTQEQSGLFFVVIADGIGIVLQISLNHNLVEGGEEVADILVFKGGGSLLYSLISVMNGLLDMLFQLSRPQARQIIRHLLQIAEQVLYALQIGEAVLLVIVNHIMVVHDTGRFRQQRQNAVRIDSGLIFVGMSAVQRDLFVAVETQTSTFRRYGDDRIIPIQRLSLQAFFFHLCQKRRQILCRAALQLDRKSVV